MLWMFTIAKVFIPEVKPSLPLILLLVKRICARLRSASTRPSVYLIITSVVWQVGPYALSPVMKFLQILKCSSCRLCSTVMVINRITSRCTNSWQPIFGHKRALAHFENKPKTIHHCQHAWLNTQSLNERYRYFLHSNQYDLKLALNESCPDCGAR